MCEENVNELLKWVFSIEHKIATVGGPREKIDELRNQINALKVRESWHMRHSAPNRMGGSK